MSSHSSVPGFSTQLRAFTPDDAKALKATVSTYPNVRYDLAAGPAAARYR